VTDAIGVLGGKESNSVVGDQVLPPFLTQLQAPGIAQEVPTEHYRHYPTSHRP